MDTLRVKPEAQHHVRTLSHSDTEDQTADHTQVTQTEDHKPGSLLPWFQSHQVHEP